MTNLYKKVMVRPEPDTLPPTTLPKDDAGWTFGDAEKAYKKYTDIVDEYKWPIEDLDGEDWVPLLNAGDTVVELIQKLRGAELTITRMQSITINREIHNIALRYFEKVKNSE
jgi:hypothetical protein